MLFPLPTGIQAAVRMLEDRLRNRSVYKDSKPKDDVPKPHRRREKRVLSTVGIGLTLSLNAAKQLKTTRKMLFVQAKALPPIKPTKQRDQRVENKMKEIRESTSRKEVPLSMHIPNSAHLWYLGFANVWLRFCTGEMGVSRQEALLLLRDMKTKYKRLYEKTMEEAGSDGNGAERLGVVPMLFVLEQHLDVESSVWGKKVLSWLISHQSTSKNKNPRQSLHHMAAWSFNMISVRFSEKRPDLQRDF